MENNNSHPRTYLLSILPFLIVIITFFVLGCLSAYFLNNAILENTSRGNVRLWSIILTISFVIVFLSGLSLLISYSSRKKKEDEAADIKSYVEELKIDLSSAYDDGGDVFFCTPEQLKRALSVTDFLPPVVQMSAQSSSVKRFRIAEDNSKTKTKKGCVSLATLMIDNLRSLKEYSNWAKNQAIIMFGVAIGACITGILIVIAAFILPIVMKLSFDTALITAIGGLITEVFAGTTLLIYRSSVKQINRYHDCMHEDQRFLYAVDLLDRFSSATKRDKIIVEIIQNQLAINLACAMDNDEEEEEAPTSTASTTTTSTDASPTSETPSEDTADAEEK